MTKIKTNISQAYWRKIEGVQPAELPFPDNKQRHDFFPFYPHEENKENTISWFDNLFDGGGIEIPTEEKPIVMLLSGPPGSGKTTLALELCSRVAVHHNFWSLFISTESSSRQLEKKAKSFGIKSADQKISIFDREKYKDRLEASENEVGIWGELTLYGKENIGRWRTFSEIMQLAIGDIMDLLHLKLNIIKKLTNKLTEQKFPQYPDILVFDSLNMVKPEERGDFFEQLVKSEQKGTKLIIVILDSSNANTGYEPWEFASDIIIRLDYGFVSLDTTSLRDYYLRSIEVVKARYQSHLWGKQQLKIYKPTVSTEIAEQDTTQKIARQNRMHPFRKEGGIFVYPSIHYYLSEYKKQVSPSPDVETVETSLEELNNVIDGFPKGRCTAFMGCRGAHKSHLGYLHLLNQVIDNNEVGIIISLRDDEGMTRQHLINILKQKLERQGKETDVAEEEAKAEVDRLLEDMLLEVLYYPPGYITSEEFFHRMLMSVYKLKGKEITLLFNSLDQIAARFPLCANQPIFVPAMIECLSGEQVTSIFIAVDEPGQPSTQYGLYPMADLILTFSNYKILLSDYYKIHKKPYPDNKENSRYHSVVLLEVSRLAGGKKAGAKGLLEVIYSKNDPKKADLLNPLQKTPGLHFTEWEDDVSLDTETLLPKG